MGADVDAGLNRELKGMLGGEPGPDVGVIRLSAAGADGLELVEQGSYAAEPLSDALSVDQSGPPPADAAGRARARRAGGACPGIRSGRAPRIRPEASDRGPRALAG